MPATTNSIKDLMLYQLNKFTRTTMKPLQSEPETPESCLSSTSTESSASSTGVEPQVVEQLPIHNYQNILPICSLNTPKPLESSRCPCGKFTNCMQHYCTDCERETRRSQTRMFLSGGQVLVNRNFSYTIASLETFAEPLPEVMPQSQAANSQPTSMTSNTCSIVSNLCNGSNASISNVSSGIGQSNGSNIRINVNIQDSVDYHMLTSHRFSINIGITETKKANSSVPNDIAFIKSQRDLLGLTGWYHGQVDWQESIRLLESTAIGTFFLRDSSDPRYVFSLSVQTPYGPISARISYIGEKYRLDCQITIANTMPSFSSILDLIDHYTKKHTSGRQEVWRDSTGHTFSPVQLTCPLRREVGTLKHLARISVNEHRARFEQQLSVTRPVPPNIRSYLADYVYTF